MKRLKNLKEARTDGVTVEATLLAYRTIGTDWNLTEAYIQKSRDPKERNKKPTFGKKKTEVNVTPEIRTGAMPIGAAPGVHNASPVMHE